MEKETTPQTEVHQTEVHQTTFGEVAKLLMNKATAVKHQKVLQHVLAFMSNVKASFDIMHEDLQNCLILVKEQESRLDILDPDGKTDIKPRLKSDKEKSSADKCKEINEFNRTHNANGSERKEPIPYTPIEMYKDVNTRIAEAKKNVLNPTKNKSKK